MEDPWNPLQNNIAFPFLLSEKSYISNKPTELQMQLRIFIQNNTEPYCVLNSLREADTIVLKAVMGGNENGSDLYGI